MPKSALADMDPMQTKCSFSIISHQYTTIPPLLSGTVFSQSNCNGQLSMDVSQLILLMEHLEAIHCKYLICIWQIKQEQRNTITKSVCIFWHWSKNLNQWFPDNKHIFGLNACPAGQSWSHQNQLPGFKIIQQAYFFVMVSPIV